MSTARASSVRKLTRVALVLELLVDSDWPPCFYQLSVSRASAEDARHHSWLTGDSGLLDSRKLEDMITLMAKYVTDEVMTRGGVQEQLFPEG